MPSRRPHTNSHHGCRQCKEKRTKCDEVKPKCGRCARRNQTCTYNHLLSNHNPFIIGQTRTRAKKRLSPQSSPHVSAVKFSRQQNVEPGLPVQWNAYPRRDEASDTAQLAVVRTTNVPVIPNPMTLTTGNACFNPLSDPRHQFFLHHYVTVVARSKHWTSQAETYRFWDIAVKQHSASHPFLLNGLLTLAALHLAAMDSDPRRRSAFLAASLRAQNAGLHVFRGQLRNLREEDRGALFTFSAMLMWSTFSYPAIKAFGGNNLISDPIGAMIQVMSLAQGMMVLYRAKMPQTVPSSTPPPGWTSPTSSSASSDASSPASSPARSLTLASPSPSSSSSPSPPPSSSSTTTLSPPTSPPGLDQSSSSSDPTLSSSKAQPQKPQNVFDPTKKSIFQSLFATIQEGHYQEREMNVEAEESLDRLIEEAIIPLGSPYVDSVSFPFPISSSSSSATSLSSSSSPHSPDRITQPKTTPHKHRKKKSKLQMQRDLLMRDSYLFNITKLRKTIRRAATHPGIANYIQMYPGMVDALYIDALRRKEPIALIILAHYAVCLSLIKNMWWVQSWGESLIRSVIREIHQLKSSPHGTVTVAGAGFWTRFLRWPMKEIGMI